MIIDGAEAHKNYHMTYYNALKAYINSLENIEDIAAVTYGTAVPEEFQSEVWKTMIE
jgi:predicted DNA-binding ArsR family transcriptional regulator